MRAIVIAVLMLLMLAMGAALLRAMFSKSRNDMETWYSVGMLFFFVAIAVSSLAYCAGMR